MALCYDSIFLASVCVYILKKNMSYCVHLMLKKICALKNIGTHLIKNYAFDF